VKYENLSDYFEAIDQLDSIEQLKLMQHILALFLINNLILILISSLLKPAAMNTLTTSQHRYHSLNTKLNSRTKNIFIFSVAINNKANNKSDSGNDN